MIITFYSQFFDIGNYIAVDEMAQPLAYEPLLNGEKGCYALVFRGWVNKTDSDRLFEIGKEHCQKKYPILMFGKTVMQPRTNCAFSDSHIKTHKYNAADGIPTASWPAEVEVIRDRIYNQWNIYMDSSLVNGYADGTQHIGAHSDKEIKDALKMVITVSVGASRKFQYIWIDSGVKVETVLHHGDCVVMYGQTNVLTKHQLPIDKKVTMPRYSFTFRTISEDTIKVVSGIQTRYPNIDIANLKTSIRAVLG